MELYHDYCPIYSEINFKEDACLASNDNISNWIDRLLSGEEEAFEYIFALTNQRIYDNVFAIVKNGYETNEIVNEVYFQLWKSISKYD
nr:hypothetical protein [Bacillus thuringiensis]